MKEFFGFSVRCADGVSIDELAPSCPNLKIGVAAVHEIRVFGYDIVVTFS